MLDSSTAESQPTLSKPCETPPDWNALEHAAEALLDLLGNADHSEDDEASLHLEHLEKFDWGNACHRRSSVLRRR